MSVNLRELLDDLTSPIPCRFDHHGHCQAHGWFGEDPICPQVRIRLVLEEEHVVEFRSTDFGLQHHIDCRPNLLACPVYKALQELDGPPLPPGRYPVWLVDDELRYGEAVA